MIQPVGNLVHLEPILKEKKSGLLMIKDETPKSYRVLAKGESVSKVNVGDEIIVEYPRQITYNDKTETIVSEDQIIARIIS
jgi:hypothetical protein